MMSLLTSNHCEMKICQCLMFYFEVWYQSAQEVTVSLMLFKLIAAAKDSWACFLNLDIIIARCKKAFKIGSLYLLSLQFT